MPKSDFEKQTLMHLFCVMVCDDIGDVDKRMEYSKQYIIKQYGSNPESKKIPLHYRVHYNKPGCKEALDLFNWAPNVYVWLLKTQPSKDIARTLSKERKKMRKKLKKFCKQK